MGDERGIDWERPAVSRLSEDFEMAPELNEEFLKGTTTPLLNDWRM